MVEQGADRWHAGIAHALEQQQSRVFAEAKHRLCNGGQRGLHHGGKRHVVEADYRYVLGHAQTRFVREKPLATTAQTAQMIVDAFSRHGVTLMEGFMYRFHPQHRRVRELIAQGAIGEVREVRAHLSVQLMNPPDPANVRFQSALGGGALLDMGCYVVSIARMVFGCEPTRAHATWVVDPRFDVDVAMTGILEFSNHLATMSRNVSGTSSDTEC
jgi:Oxidoreductase family, C-terminal alpha/beta domain